MFKKALLYLVFCFLPIEFFSQVLIDSLYKQHTYCNSDSCQIRIQNQLVTELVFIDLQKALDISVSTLSKVNRFELNNFLTSKSNYGTVLLKLERFEEAKVVFQEIKKNAIENKLADFIAKANLGLSKYYIEKNELKYAITLAFDALRQFEKSRDYNNVSLSYGQIASINYKLKNHTKSIDYFKKSLEIATKYQISANIAYAYNNLGNLYSTQTKMFDIALEYYKRALNIRRQYKHELEIAPILSNMATIYIDRKQYDLAETTLNEALALNIKNKRDHSTAINLINIGNIHYNLNQFDLADKNYRRALQYINDDFQVKELLYYNLGEVNLKLGNLKEALLYNDTCMTIKDSLYSREAIKSLNDMQVKYETEKTKLELEKKDLESKNKQIAIYAALGGCLLLLGLVFFVFRGYKNKEKTNLALEEKNKIITEKSKIVEEQHKDITDSIKYAERIQTAILPPDKLWQEILPQSFVFYNPKDILSGDFYWIEETKTHIFLAAADCTGHGVPGALVSIVNYNLLNKAVLEKELSDPAKILDQVNIWLTQALHQSYNGSHVRDGMDVAICAINKNTKVMQFAGAFNGGYLIKDGEITELVADKKPVGAFIEDDITSFTMKEYQLTGNESVYLFSDGYADQFGGPKGKKFKYKNLQNLLLSVQDLSFKDQQKRIMSNFIEWKGTYEQTDDVLVIGFKFI
ncbi:MAG: tetratricopeptide repeat protein [Sphingobacteriaceae bacterium]